jgi:hypothetical protein
MEEEIRKEDMRKEGAWLVLEGREGSNRSRRGKDIRDAAPHKCCHPEFSVEVAQFVSLSS